MKEKLIMCDIRYSTIQSIEKLCNDLNLSDEHKYSEEWECEVANEYRIDEFITYYQMKLTDDNEKFTLMQIIVESCNDALGNGNLDNEVWKKIKNSLILDCNIHKYTIEYWSDEEEDKDIEDCFVITPLIREVRNEIKDYK